MVKNQSTSLIEIDIHHMTRVAAKDYVIKILNTARPTVKEIRVIHGYQSGQALLNMVRKELKHVKIKKKYVGLNQGITTLELN